MPSVELLLGPPLGAAGLAAAVALLMRDAALGASMEAAKQNASSGAGFLSSIIAFFAASCESAAGRLVWAPLLGLVLVVTAMFGLEAGRFGARGPVRWFSLWALLYQLAGIGFITPALWLPAYAASARHAASLAAPRRITLARARATAGVVATAALLSFAVAQWPVRSPAWRAATAAAQFIFVLGAAYLPLRAPRADEDTRGAAAATKLYTLLAGASATLYWLQLAACAAAPPTLAEFATNGAAAFLALDLAGLCCAALLLVRLEQGRWAAALPGAAWGAVLSPGGALALYLAEREGRLAAEGAQERGGEPPVAVMTPARAPRKSARKSG